MLDSITSLSEDDIKLHCGKEGQRLADTLKSGTIWNEADAYFDNSLPKDIAPNMVMSLTRHMRDLVQLQQQVEAHLTSLDPNSDDYDAMSEVYALHVLPRCGEWDAARGFIETSDFSDEKRDQWLQYISQIQAAELEERQRQVAEEEEIRKADQEDKKLRKIRKVRKSGSKRSVVSVSESNPATTILPGQGPAKAIAEGNDSRNEPVVTVNYSPDVITNSTSAIGRWSNTLTSTLHLTFRPRVIRILIFLALLFGATGRREIREKIKAALGKVSSTIIAGFKVSYI